MDLNIITFTYLFLRLAPFILVCFFSLASIFNSDFKGLVYLIGLLCACFANVMLGGALTFIPAVDMTTRPEICSAITISGAADVSKLPMGQTVFGYTFAYLLYTILSPKENLVNKNIPTIIFFTVLILFDGWWNANNGCYNIWQLLASLIIGSIAGVIWAAFIDSTNDNSLKYFAGLNNNEVCGRAAKQTFKCNVYKNGKLIQQQ